MNWRCQKESAIQKFGNITHLCQKRLWTGVITVILSLASLLQLAICGFIWRKIMEFQEQVWPLQMWIILNPGSLQMWIRLNPENLQMLQRKPKLLLRIQFVKSLLKIPWVLDNNIFDLVQQNCNGISKWKSNK